MANSEKLLQQQKPRQTGASEPIGQAVVNVSLFDLTGCCAHGETTTERKTLDAAKILRYNWQNDAASKPGK